jgi:hypothetical protein
MFIFILKSPFIQYCIVIDDTFSVVKLLFFISFLSYVCKIQEISILDFMGGRGEVTFATGGLRHQKGWETLF